MYSIYKHTSPTGKSYIGITGLNDPEQRWLKGSGYYNQRLFYTAIKVWGWDNLTHEILEDGVSTKEEAHKKEAEYIQKYDSFYNGYNSRPCEGGGAMKIRCLLGWSGKHQMEETYDFFFDLSPINGSPLSTQKLISKYQLTGPKLDQLIEDNAPDWEKVKQRKEENKKRLEERN